LQALWEVVQAGVLKNLLNVWGLSLLAVAAAYLVLVDLGHHGEQYALSITLE
jgi:hypothetical protein